MKILGKTILVALAAVFSACTSQKDELYSMIDGAFRNAQHRYISLADSMLVADSGRLPHSLNEDGSMVSVKPVGWTSGFFPGTLWYMYEYLQDDALKSRAETFTAILEDQQYNNRTHDIGFMMFCSYGNSNRLFPDQAKKQILINSADALCSRFNPVVGCTRSWDHMGERKGWYFPVIIDNMMNLELLLWAWQETGDQKYLDVAQSHARTTAKNHFREDNSSYHVVNYDPETGAILFQGTHQGLADDSSWSRGQGWGLYGYTVMYRFTKDEFYLEKAQNIARYIMTYQPAPEDKVFLWDYKAPADAPRDASAAALCASALLELCGLTADKELSKEAYTFAVDILKSLSSEDYTAKSGTNGGFILKHSVTSFPTGKEIDKPLCYADYYYLEALLRLKNILDNDNQN